MLRPLVTAAAAFGLASAPLAAQDAPPPAPRPAPVLPKLNPAQSQALTCAAVFAIVASEQARGVDAARAYPPLKVRGREYFVRIGARTMDETGATREAVRALLEGEVARLQQLAMTGQDPDAVLTAQMKPCQPLLDAEVAPLPKPTLAQCTAIMQLAFEEVYAREGLNGDEAKDLKILSSVLESRQRKAMQALGLPAPAIDQAIAQEHDRMLKDVLADSAGVEKYDLSVCYDLAKPDEKTHY